MPGRLLFGVTLFAAALLAMSCTAAWAQDAGAPAMVSQGALTSATASGVNDDYLIGPDDQLDISVFQISDLSRAVQVDSGGKILLPLIGQVTAAGRTSSQLSEDIATLLKAKYVRNPMVTVTVKDAASQKVTVDGAVNSPGMYPLTGPTTLLQAVALAKGTDPKTCNERKVSLYRLVNGQRYGTQYDLAAIKAGRAPDPQVYGRDVIVVPSSGSKSFWREFMGVAQVLAIARP